MFGGSRKFVTGLDVGAESVKAVVLLHARDRVKLVGIALAEIDYPAVDRSATDEGANAARIDAIKSALKASGTDISVSCRVVTAVAGPSVSVKHVTFPKMANPNLAESIGWEAKKHVPFGASEFVLDFQLLAREAGEEADEMHVLLAAVEQRHIDSHVELVCDAGVEPSAVDIVPLALMNELGAQGLVKDGAVASVEMGASTLSVSIYRAGGLLLVRSVSMPATTGAGSAAASGGEGESEKARRRWQTFVLKEVKRSLAFYNSETGRRGIDKIYLSGGRALAEGVAERFTDALKVPTEVLNPLQDLAEAKIDIESLLPQGPRFALAMSLARRK
ncbi:MAG: type IV pilus assembly protein PilM [Candidatus Eisenbacteria sp.]|nr:type IV pilus assembly protein PilM [Candidatus Eisenbacteria bacterium]